ncbi:MAG TPA: substrate-binding domain-containing protein [Candidatus Limnocylindrales bacterium]
MLAHERQAHIVNSVRTQGVVRVADLVAELGVSSMTVRRDLDVLASRGMIEKFHGGASLRGPKRVHATPTSEVDGGAATSGGQIGIVVPAGDYYFASILGGIRQSLDAQAIRRSLVRPPRDPEQERKLAEELISSGAAGLVLAPSIDLERPEPGYARWLLSLPVPVVLVEREVRDEESGRTLSTVRTDHENGCRTAVAHLRQLGHQGVALITHGESQSGTRVMNGWSSAVGDAGMAGKRSPLITIEDRSGGGYGTNEIIDGVLDKLREARVTAVICHSDHIALPLVHRAKVRGWSIPRDLSVIAHDDESAEMADPPLTAVSPPKSWIGETAARTLLELLAAGPDGPVRQVVAEPRLVLRHSTAAPP